MPGTDEWAEYAPYDRGWLQNTLSFFRAQRDVPSTTSARRRSVQADDSDTELAEINVQSHEERHGMVKLARAHTFQT